MSFHTLNLDARLLRNVEQEGYTIATPIQRKAIPAILDGRDVVGLAQTGTGKTAAFVLPLLHRLMNGPRRKLRALIVGPTRELAEQTKAVLVKLGHQTGFRHVTIYGGVGQQPQVNGVRQGAEIAIACPGRLLDLLGQNKFTLDHVECLVLDEADRMFDMGFLPEIRKILKRLPARHQTLLFSATMPDEIRTLVHEILSDPVTVQIAHSMPAETVDHALYPVEPGQKATLLLELLKTLGDGSVLVFTRTKHRAKKLAKQLNAAGVPAVELQGNMSQGARERSMKAFHSGDAQTLVATDVAARGIHVDDVGLVIHADPPVEHKAYTHRSGRTARAGAEGTVVTLMLDAQRGDVRQLTRKAGVKPTVTRADDRHPVLLEIAPGVREFPGGIVKAEPQQQSRGGGGGRRRSPRSDKPAGQRSRNGEQPRSQRQRGGRRPEGQPQARVGGAAAFSASGGGRRRGR